MYIFKEQFFQTKSITVNVQLASHFSLPLFMFYILWLTSILVSRTPRCDLGGTHSSNDTAPSEAGALKYAKAILLGFVRRKTISKMHTLSQSELQDNADFSFFDF